MCFPLQMLEAELASLQAQLAEHQQAESPEVVEGASFQPCHALMRLWLQQSPTSVNHLARSLLRQLLTHTLLPAARNDPAVQELAALLAKSPARPAQEPAPSALSFQRLSQAVEDLWTRLDSSPFVRLSFKVPRLTVATVNAGETSPLAQLGNQGDSYDNSDKRYWMHKVQELTVQMQQSSSFWMTKVKAASEALESHQGNCRDAFETSAGKTKHVVRLLFDIIKALLHLLAELSAHHQDPTDDSQAGLKLAIQGAVSSIGSLRDSLFEMPPSPSRQGSTRRVT